MTKMILLLLAISAGPTFALALPSKTVQIASFEAPPFISSEMPDQGAAAYAMKKIFKELGYDLVVKIYPIRRAKKEALRNPDIDGYSPASEFDDLGGMVLSKPASQTLTLLLQNREKPIDWSDQSALSKYRGGNVRGYFLKGPLKAMDEAGKLKLEEAPNDVLNIIKLGEKRLDYVLITDSMYRFLMVSDPRLAPYATKVEANPKPVTAVQWGIAFKAHQKHSARILKEFNEKVDTQKFKAYVEEYLRKMMAEKKQKPASPVDP